MSSCRQGVCCACARTNNTSTIIVNARFPDDHRTPRAKQEQQREREAGLVSAVASLETEKEALTRKMEMAQERFATIAAVCPSAGKNVTVMTDKTPPKSRLFSS